MGKGTNPQSACVDLLFCNFSSRKLHENERIWTQRRDASLAPPLDPSMFSSVKISIQSFIGGPRATLVVVFAFLAQSFGKVVRTCEWCVVSLCVQFEQLEHSYVLDTGKS